MLDRYPLCLHGCETAWLLPDVYCSCRSRNVWGDFFYLFAFQNVHIYTWQFIVGPSFTAYPKPWRGETVLLSAQANIIRTSIQQKAEPTTCTYVGCPALKNYRVSIYACSKEGSSLYLSLCAFQGFLYLNTTTYMHCRMCVCVYTVL